MRQRVMLLSIVFLLSVSGCSEVQVQKYSLQDSAAFQYEAGMAALEAGRPEQARSKFEAAVSIDKGFADGYSGLALALVGTGADQEAVLKALDNASDNAKTGEEKFTCQVARIQVYSGLKGKEWLKRCQEAYAEAKDLKVDSASSGYYSAPEALDYFMGVACFEAKDYAKAESLFSSVMQSRPDGRWAEKADREWTRANRLVRAESGTSVSEVGTLLAPRNSVSRAELAALLVDELRLADLSRRLFPTAAEARKVSPSGTVPVPQDIAGNPFRTEIVDVEQWKIRGLESLFNEKEKAYFFKPTASVTRADMALVLEDVIVKLAGNSRLARAYYGQETSPFADVPPTSYAYNAIMTVTTRGIMGSSLSGEFRPDDPVSGTDALLAIQALKRSVSFR